MDSKIVGNVLSLEKLSTCTLNYAVGVVSLARPFT